MTVRPYQPELDYQTLAAWWAHYDPADREPWKVLPLSGGVVMHEGSHLVAAFAYLTLNCPVVHFDRLVWRPGADPGMLREGGKLLFDYLRNYSKANGYGVAYAHVKRAGMARELEHLGYEMIADNVKILGRVL